MNPVNLNLTFGTSALADVQKSNAKASSQPSIFTTPAPSVETAGSVASAAPSSGGSFSATC